MRFNIWLHGAADVRSLKSVMVGAQVCAQRCHKLQVLLHIAFTALRSRCIELHTCTCALTCSQSKLNVRRMWLHRLRAMYCRLRTSCAPPRHHSGRRFRALECNASASTALSARAQALLTNATPALAAACVVAMPAYLWPWHKAPAGFMLRRRLSHQKMMRH